VAPAEFSELPGLRRIFIPVGGSVSLRVEGRSYLVEDGCPFHFSGDAATTLEWLSVPCFALNFMSHDAALTLGREHQAEARTLAVVPLEDGTGGDESGAVGRFDVLVPQAAATAPSGVSIDAARLPTACVVVR
jgi:hypothetical protein